MCVYTSLFLFLFFSFLIQQAKKVSKGEEERSIDFEAGVGRQLVSHMTNPVGCPLIATTMPVDDTDTHTLAIWTKCLTHVLFADIQTFLHSFYSVGIM